MNITIVSDKKIDKETVTSIYKIFEESECPNETLKNTYGFTYNPKTKTVTIDTNGKVNTSLYIQNPKVE